VPYSLEDYQGCFRSYLNNRDDLSRADRVRLYGFLDTLRNQGDTYRNNPDLRCSPASPNFKFEFIFQDSQNEVRIFRLVVNDAPAVYGVLRIVYVDEV
jgi:hypothetical protein